MVRPQCSAKAKLFKLATTQKQQFDLYRRVQGVRTKINVEKKDVCGNYSLGDNDCGRWVINMIHAERIAVPEGFGLQNLFGTGLGGPSELVTRPVTGAAMIYGYSALGVRNMAAWWAEQGRINERHFLESVNGVPFGDVPTGGLRSDWWEE